jgi:uncharacterized protein (TIGR02466 family)
MVRGKRQAMKKTDGQRGTAVLDGVHAAFSTPLLVKRYGDDDGLNAKLLEHILAREAKEATRGMSNVGGWHSPADLLGSSDPAIHELRKRVANCIRKVVLNNRFSALALERSMHISAWANVARDGAYNAVHNHTPAVFSGVYYVSTGEPAPEDSREGLIEFIDPRPGPHGGTLPTHAFNAPLIIDPEPGMMLVFPGWLLHYVHPYRGTAPRVSVAFNLWLDRDSSRS